MGFDAILEFYLSHYRQLFADIKIINKKIKTSFISIEMILILIVLENCLQYDDTYDFSVWLRAGSNPWLSDLLNFALKCFHPC